MGHWEKSSGRSGGKAPWVRGQRPSGLGQEASSDLEQLSQGYRHHRPITLFQLHSLAEKSAKTSAAPTRAKPHQSTPTPPQPQPLPRLLI